MKKAKLLLTISLLSLGALASCTNKNNDQPAETEKEEEKPGKEDDKPGEDEKPGDDKPGTPDKPPYGDDDEDEGEVNPPVVIKKDFSAALEKDYRNMTASYYISSTEEWGYEYYAQDLVLVYDGAFAELYGNDYGGYSPYTFYSHEYNGDFYAYWRQATGYSHDGWIATGLYDSDLAIYHAYFYMQSVIDVLEADDVEYYSVTGQYYVKDEALDKVLDAFEWAFWTNDPHAIAFTMNDEGYINTVVGIDNPAREDSPYFKIVLTDFGTTSFPQSLPFDVPETPNPSNIYTYKEMTGKDADDRIYPSEVTLDITEEHKSDDTYDLILDIDESIDVACLALPENFNRTNYEWVSTNENVVAFDFKQNFTSGHRYATGIAEGDAEIYVISHDERNHTKVESNHIKVHVNKVQEIENENAIYEFTYQGLEEFTVYDEEQEKEIYGGERVTAQNLKGNALPYTITTFRGELLDGAYTEALTGYDKLLALSPCTSNHMNDGFYNEITYDFSDQQVSKFETYYSLHNSGQAQNINYLRTAKLMTSNDGVNWEEIDIKDELVATFKATNGDYELNKKILSKEFAPASIVKLHLEGSMVGKNMQFVFAGTSFEANDECHAHISGDVTPVESVTISGDKTSFNAYEKVNFTASVLPENATNKNVRWHSSDESVVTIDAATGVATGVAAGTAKIYATSVDGDVKSNEIEVNVTLPTVPSDFIGTYVGEIVYDLAYHDITLEISEHGAHLVDTKGEEVKENDFEYFGKDSYFYHFEAEDGLCLDITSSQYSNKLDIKIYKGNTYYAGAKNDFDTLNKITYAKSVTIKDKNGDKTLTSLSLIEGETYTPWVDPSPLDVTDPTITASTSNAAVATVSGHKITAVGAGDCVITYTAVGGAKAELPVHVDEKVTITSLSITGISDGATIKTNETVNLTASYLPANANVKNLSWKTSDPEVLTVTNDGKVTGVAAGTAIITVEDGYTHLKAQVTITVSTEVSECVFGDLIGTYDLYDETDIEGLFVELKANNTMVFTYNEEVVLELKLSKTVSANNYEFVNVDSSDDTVYEVQVSSSQVFLSEKGQDVVWFLYELDGSTFLNQIVIR